MVLARRLWNSITGAVSRAVPVVAEDEWVGDAATLARADVAMITPITASERTQRHSDNTQR